MNNNDMDGNKRQCPVGKSTSGCGTGSDWIQAGHGFPYSFF